MANPVTIFDGEIVCVNGEEFDLIFNKINGNNWVNWVNWVNKEGNGLAPNAIPYMIEMLMQAKI